MSVVNVKFAGLGGTGVIKASDVMAELVFEQGYDVKKAEVHGMSQRGGDVQSHFRISDKPIWSDLVPMGKADIIISVEPMESLRYLPWLNPETGWIVTNTNPFINIDNYPDVNELMAELKKQPRCIAIDGDGIAKEVNNARGMNMVIAGAASLFTGLDINIIRKGVEVIFGSKGEEIVKANLAAINAGWEFAEKNSKK